MKKNFRFSDCLGPNNSSVRVQKTKKRRKRLRQKQKSLPVCSNCKSQYHSMKYCPELRCSHCGEYDHVLSAKVNGKIVRCPNMWCEFCQSKNHTSEKCSRRKCRSCGEGHRTENCGYVTYPFRV